MTATPDATVDYATVETATLGHFLSDGFMVPAIQSVSSGIRIAGPALTVRLPGDDGMALVEALSIAEPGQIVVVDRCGDLRHACWGAVTTNAAIARGVKGAIIDGFITDLSAIRELGFPVWCRGRSPITTRQRGLGGNVNHRVACGGVSVAPGDLVIADENGVVVLPPSDAEMHCTRALAMQANEPELIRRLHAGETMADLAQPKEPRVAAD
ncbi:Regulator of RNase E activity RraA [Salipiger thiooxidans]|uniref:Putative 4-hydroxy-4-methyl-2-oxoglutarate aldolase n=1 Tax=Salipiger thiooxidans TaxID=282683 RepID=A0A1G7BJ94_9RHOB|nr:RraA family protein [Salipiger thiooxidans]SDE27053.1 Regulator of RNase E activity RraA [Salipiger thiooxidans]